MGWHDDGVKLRLYLSTSGDYVSLGTRTDYPFESGGANGVPLGWYTMSYLPDVNFTTQSGRASISFKGTHTTVGTSYGFFRDFPGKKGMHYVFTAESRTMEGKSATKVRVAQQASGFGMFGIDNQSQSDWTNAASVNDPGFASDVSIRISLNALTSGAPDWGVQFQNVAITEIPDVVPEPTWQEVTCDIRSMQTRYGREQKASRYEVGSMSLGIINDDGEYTYRDPHPWGLRPGRFIKVEATYNGTTYPVYYGIIDGMSDGYTLDGHVLLVMNCIDMSSLLSNTTVPTVNSDTTILDSGARFAQMLRAVGWKPDGYTYDAGVFLQQPILANGRKVRDELGLIADSEGSYFYTNRLGKLRYRNRDWSEDRINKVGAELLAEREPEPVATPYVAMQFPRVAGNYVDTPSSAALNIAGDISIAVRVSFDSFTVVGWQALVSKYTDTAQGWLLAKQSGTKRFTAWVGGGARATTVDVPYNAGDTFWLRVSRTMQTGVTNWYHAPDQDSEPTNWTYLSGATAAAGVGQTSTTVPVALGAYSDGSTPFGGRIRRVIVRGTGTTPVLDVNDSSLMGLAGKLTFNADTAQVMTVHQTGANVILQDATEYQALPIVDAIPNISPDIPMVCTRAFETSWSRDRVMNQVSISNQGGRAITVVDAESQKKYGPRTFQRMDLLNDNAHPEYILQRIDDLMSGYTEAVLRINQVQFRPTDQSWPWALDVWLNDLVRVRYQSPLHDWGFSIVAHVQGIQHSAGLDDWVSTISLDDYEAFAFWQGSLPGEGWDASTWDDDLWDGGYIGKWSSNFVWSDSSTVWGK